MKALRARSGYRLRRTARDHRGRPWRIRSASESWSALDPRTRRIAVAIAYIVAIGVAEVVTNLAAVRLGLAIHGLILVALIAHAAATPDDARRPMLLTLTFAPLIRIVSLSLPLGGLPVLAWYALVSVPLLAAAVVMARTLGWSWRDVGVVVRQPPLQAIVAASGLALGCVEYAILRPAPLEPRLTWARAVVAVVVLVGCTGFTEELIFRGFVQRAAVAAMGRWGVVYVALLFAVLHVGWRSPLDVLFVFGVGLFFGWVVLTTGSLVGVTLSHGINNVILFVVLPLLPLGGALTLETAPRAVVPVQVTMTPLPSIPASTPRVETIAVVAVTAMPTFAVTSMPEATSVPTSAPTIEPTPLEANPVAIVNAAAVNVRSGPGVGYARIAVANLHSRYDIVGRGADVAWWRVCCVNGVDGWVAAQYVDVEGSTESVVVAAAPPGSTPGPVHDARANAVPPEHTPLPPATVASAAAPTAGVVSSTPAPRSPSRSRAGGTPIATARSQRR